MLSVAQAMSANLIAALIGTRPLTLIIRWSFRRYCGAAVLVNC